MFMIMNTNTLINVKGYMVGLFRLHVQPVYTHGNVWHSDELLLNGYP